MSHHKDGHMPKRILKLTIIIAIVGIVVAASYSVCKISTAPRTATTLPATNKTLSETEARVIAEHSCIKGGKTNGAGLYNDEAKTWWFDANLNATRPGCAAGCVVDVATQTAELNWRCAGLLPPPAPPFNLNKKVIDNKQWINYAYPETLPTTYYHLQDWAQTGKVLILNQPFVCPVGRDGLWQVEQASINGKKYCVRSQSDAAAGTIYTTYNYLTPLLDDNASVTFVISHPTSCRVYDGMPDEVACEKETFDPNALADQIVGSIRFTESPFLLR